MGSNPTLSAIESPNAETFRLPRRSDREVPAIPRGLGLAGLLMRTRDATVRGRMTASRAFVSAAKFGGPLALVIRPSGTRRMRTEGSRDHLRSDQSAPAARTLSKLEIVPDRAPWGLVVRMLSIGGVENAACFA